MTASFIHLHVHSEYSLEDGIIRIPDLIQRCRAGGMPAVALTDHGNLFAFVKFYQAARYAGIKPIAGCEVYIHNPQEPQQPTQLVLLCQDNDGYRHLMQLVSRGYLEGLGDGRPQIQRDWLLQAQGGLIALSAAGRGEIGRALLKGQAAQAKTLAEWYAACFPGCFYLELQRNGEAQQEALVADTVALAAALGLPVVATNNAHFLDEADFPAFETRVCISSGWTLNDTRRPRVFSPAHRFKSPAEMCELFADLPEALENSVQIAMRCNVTLTLGKNVLPDFPTPDNVPLDPYFAEQSRQGLTARLALMRVDDAAPYWQRLEVEIQMIQQMGFAGYFLIVADFIQWAKHNGVPVGPGRGSGAGSLVAFALLITDIDPLRYGLLFERFLNPERVSMPDFDVDFCMIGRDRVIAYVAQKYGHSQVAQIITYGSMKARAVVRDVGRAMNKPYGEVDRLAKLVPPDLGMTLKQALIDAEELGRRYAEEEDVRELLDVAMRLEGLARHASTHAGGVVIAPGPLTDYVPLFNDGSDSGGNVTQFDKDDVEKVGLVKFDFLGLRTLTIIDKALQHIHRAGITLDLALLPMDDAPTFTLLKSAESVAIFQLESSGMRDLIRRLQPDCFEDIIALVALFRPGPLQSGMVDDFINRKHGKARVSYPHPDMEPVLKETYGVMVYQEQVMQAAQVLAGYTLGGADLLRRAMGKKKAEEMAKQRESFLSGAAQNQIPASQANAIFDLMEKFAEYGFNKSHSAAYAMVSYQTAYLKTHHPEAFMAAVLSADMDNTDKVVGLLAECERMQIRVDPPDANSSTFEFMPVSPGIRFGLGAIKGLGEGAIEAIVDARGEQPFLDLFDFARRVDARRVNRRSYEALIKSGAMDSLGGHRAALLATLPVALDSASQWHEANNSGQDSLFGAAAEIEMAEHHLADTPVWGLHERLRHEREVLGLFLSGHPMDTIHEALRGMEVQPIPTLKAGNSALIVGLVVERRNIRTRKGDRMMILTLDDKQGRIEVTLFPEALQNSSVSTERMDSGEILAVLGEVSEDSYSNGLRVTVSRLMGLEEARLALAQRLLLRFNGQSQANMPAQLAAYLGQHSGNCEVVLHYENASASTEIRLPERWRVAPRDALLAVLDGLPGLTEMTLQYQPASVLVNSQRQRGKRLAVSSNG